jgi:hypothetical protein
MCLSFQNEILQKTHILVRLNSKLILSHIISKTKNSNILRNGSQVELYKRKVEIIHKSHQINLTIKPIVLSSTQDTISLHKRNKSRSSDRFWSKQRRNSLNRRKPLSFSRRRSNCSVQQMTFKVLLGTEGVYRGLKDEKFMNSIVDFPCFIFIQHHSSFIWMENALPVPLHL